MILNHGEGGGCSFSLLYHPGICGALAKVLTVLLRKLEHEPGGSQRSVPSRTRNGIAAFRPVPPLSPEPR